MLCSFRGTVNRQDYRQTDVTLCAPTSRTSSKLENRMFFFLSIPLAPNKQKLLPPLTECDLFVPLNNKHSTMETAYMAQGSSVDKVCDTMTSETNQQSLLIFSRDAVSFVNPMSSQFRQTSTVDRLISVGIFRRRFFFGAEIPVGSSG